MSTASSCVLLVVEQTGMLAAAVSAAAGLRISVYCDPLLHADSYCGAG
jgi:hypothetical protein